mmetsp:Transcript_971/g.1701  ORF Transcript_971/g.1701 Transcript_971/m.1701 type:complete len:118 (+) Transcript_971:672-1025(+)
MAFRDRSLTAAADKIYMCSFFQMWTALFIHLLGAPNGVALDPNPELFKALKLFVACAGDKDPKPPVLPGTDCASEAKPELPNAADPPLLWVVCPNGCTCPPSDVVPKTGADSVDKPK